MALIPTLNDSNILATDESQYDNQGLVDISAEEINVFQVSML